MNELSDALSERLPDPLQLKNAWLQNLCGDEACEGRRMNAALLVLRGGSKPVGWPEDRPSPTHLEYAIAVENHHDHRPK